MATKLKKVHLTSVDLVRAGANQEADICLYKSAEPPTEPEKNIFKRFLAWMKNPPAEAEHEPENPIEKADEPPAEIYKGLILESVQSIVADETLSTDEKISTIEKSFEQFYEAMEELEKSESEEDESTPIEGSENPEEEEVEKHNPNHNPSFNRYDEIEEI